ncbi:MAG: glucokinase [Burkholderiales bacterium]
MILAGDIGGTSTRLALFEKSGERLRIAVEKVYPSQQHASLEEIVRKFIVQHPMAITAAAFGIAGPVRDGRVQTPNLAWIVDGKVVAREMGLENVGLINDLEANAWGIAALQDDDFATLNPGVPQAIGNQAVISAGTGLGEAGLYWDGKQHRPFACEGGHCDFAPRNAAEMRVLVFLLAEFDRVSYERLLSGPGLHNIFRALRSETVRTGRDALDETFAVGDPAAAISRAALANSHPVAVQALEMFVSLYGAEAGNVALKMMATGGVFIGGGIAPRIIEKMRGPSFIDAFLAKGRMRPLLEAMPVKVILNDKTALMGAGRYAATS